MFGESFDQAFTQAIVNQFFSSTPGFTDGNGLWHPERVSPVSQVVAKMLTEKQEALVKAIFENIDLDVLAGDISDRIVEQLTAPERERTWNYTPTLMEVKKQELRAKIDARFVELVAQQMFANLKDMPPTTIDTDLNRE